MFDAPTLQGEFTLIFSEDPALNLPADPEERVTALRVARETGNWRAITLAGREPTTFACAPLHGSALTWLRGECVRADWSNEELFEFAFRLSARRVDNLGGLTLRHEKTPRGHKILTIQSIDELYDTCRPVDATLGRRMVQELGVLIFSRATEPIDPKR